MTRSETNREKPKFRRLQYDTEFENLQNCSDSFRVGGLELAQRTAHIGQRVPVLTRRTVLRWLRRLAGVGNRVPELSTGAIQRLCRTDPGAEERQGDRSGREKGDGRTT